MTTPENSRLPYLAPLDGIRAVAILAVLLFHVWPASLPGGFTGVDVFFVLSGFLITSIILSDLRGGVFSLLEFYLRRVQRLLPNTILMVLAVLALWAFFLPPSTSRQPAIHGLWTIFNLSNIYVWKFLGGYWGNAAEMAPLTHTWSLGIEEQFYLFFPTCLLVLARFQPTRIRAWLIAVAALSLGLSVYGSYTHPVGTFYLLPTRLWELLFGGILAARRAPGRREAASSRSPYSSRTPYSSRHPHASRPPLSLQTRERIGWAGLALIVAGFLAINERQQFPGLVALAPTVGTVLLIWSVAEGETRLSRLLSLPFLVGTGKLSYSLYLWHWPLITLGKIMADLYGWPRLAGAAAGGAAGVLLGCVAYVAVERPLRKRGPGRLWRLAATAVGFSLAARWSGAIASRPLVADPGNRFDPPLIKIGFYDAGRNAGLDVAAASIPFFDVYFPPLPPRPDDMWRTGGIIHPYGGGQPKVVVFGSSHALMYSRLIDDLCRELGRSVAFLGVDDGTRVFFEATVNPNFPSPDVAREFDEARKQWLREWHPDVVFVIDRWDMPVDEPAVFDRKLRSFLREVSPLVGRVVFVAQAPVARVGAINLRDFVTWRMGKGEGLPRLLPDQNEPVRKQAVAVAEGATAEFPNLRVLRTDLPFYQPDGSIRYAEGRNFFYADDNHLADSGTEEVRGLFQAAITEAHAKPASR